VGISCHSAEEPQDTDAVMSSKSVGKQRWWKITVFNFDLSSHHSLMIPLYNSVHLMEW